MVSRALLSEQKAPLAFLFRDDKPHVDEEHQWQLAGEMLGVAITNYQNTGVAQTICAMSLKGMNHSIPNNSVLRVQSRIVFYTYFYYYYYYLGVRAAVYRADFPVSYLESIETGNPVGHVVIFKYLSLQHQENFI